MLSFEYIHDLLAEVEHSFHITWSTCLLPHFVCDLVDDIAGASCPRCARRLSRCGCIRKWVSYGCMHRRAWHMRGFAGCCQCFFRFAASAFQRVWLVKPWVTTRRLAAFAIRIR